VEAIILLEMQLRCVFGIEAKDGFGKQNVSRAAANEATEHPALRRKHLHAAEY
jgi:hypothetical protein